MYCGLSHRMQSTSWLWLLVQIERHGHRRLVCLYYTPPLICISSQRVRNIKGTLSRCSARANLTGFFHQKTLNGTVTLSRHADATKWQISAICILRDSRSRSSLNYRKKGQLAQLVRESDLVFRVKRQIKTVLTNVVLEHMKSRMSNAKKGNSKSVVHNKPEYADVQMLW